MTRKEAAKDILYADWAVKGRDAGFLMMLAEAIRGETRDSSPWNNELPHHALLELGRVKGLEEILFKLVDPLGSHDDKPVPRMPAPTYGVKP
jgi:hypothetical protein